MLSQLFPNDIYSWITVTAAVFYGVNAFMGAMLPALSSQIVQDNHLLI